MRGVSISGSDSIAGSLCGKIYNIRFTKMYLKSVIRNISLINILLISVATLFASYILLPLLEVKVIFSTPSPKKNVGTVEDEETQAQTPSIAEYAVITDENLFHPERKIPVEKKVEEPLPKPDFLLFGTLITDGVSLAYLEDAKAPRNTAGRGKRQVALKKGDSLSGFTLKEIEPDKVTMVRGNEKIIVAISDHPRERTTAPSAPAASAPGQPQPPGAAPPIQRRVLQPGTTRTRPAPSYR